MSAEHLPCPPTSAPSTILREGNLSDVKKLVRMDVLAREIDHLELPENIRDFWSLVLKKITERQPLNSHA